MWSPTIITNRNKIEIEIMKQPQLQSAVIQLLTRTIFITTSFKFIGTCYVFIYIFVFWENKFYSTKSSIDASLKRVLIQMYDKYALQALFAVYQIVNVIDAVRWMCELAHHRAKGLRFTFIAIWSKQLLCCLAVLKLST